MDKTPAELKAEILRLTREYSARMHGANRPATDVTAPFVPGQTTVPYAARVFNADEVEAAVGATLDFWLTLGPEGAAFESELAALLGVKYSLLVNSGSSANIIAFTTLTTHKLPAAKRIQPGDEVITVAAGFTTTVAPIIQAGAVPAVRDVDRDAELVHPGHGALAEERQAPVASLLEAGAEGVGLRVGDAHGTDAEAVEDVDPVDLY